MKSLSSPWGVVRAGSVVEILESRLFLSGGQGRAALPVLPAIASAGSISGIVFDDRNGVGIRELHDRGLAGITVTIQKVRRGLSLGHASTTTTELNGDYAFTGLTAATY